MVGPSFTDTGTGSATEFPAYFDACGFMWKVNGNTVVVSPMGNAYRFHRELDCAGPVWLGGYFSRGTRSSRAPAPRRPRRRSPPYSMCSVIVRA